MKRFLTICCLLWMAPFIQISAQFNNEWIDYSKTYYKFLVGEDGLYRISRATLEAAGIGNTPAQHFQLWRNGEEVPLFTSQPSGPLDASGFIEFVGRKNDGKPDRALYKIAAHQLSDHISLLTDTAAYFLTVNSTGSNRRYQVVANETGGPLPPMLPYLWHTVRHDYRGVNDSLAVNRGFATFYGENVYSSTYDEGEMMSSYDIFPSRPGQDLANRLAVFNNLLPATGASVSAQMRISWAGSAFNTRTVQADINGTPYITRQIVSHNAHLDSNMAIPAAALNQPVVRVSVQHLNNANSFDRFVAGFVELRYPRQLNAGGGSYLATEIPATGTAALLRLSGFAHSQSPPVLVNLTAGTRMQGVIDGSGDVLFVLPAFGVAQQVVVASTAQQSVRTVTALTTRNFLNLSLPANQAAYIIITHPRLLTGTNNAIEQYRAYRSSAAGGGFNTRIYDINELVDQFAFGIKLHPLSVKNFLRYARSRFATAPRFCFLIGKAVTYDEARVHERNPLLQQLHFVPTFGYPASDNLLASDDYGALPATPIGRLSAINNAEILAYLDKVREYEAVQANPSVTQADKLWMKNVIHVVGASESITEAQIRPSMAEFTRTISDTLFGGRVTTFNKFTSTVGSTIDNQVITRLLETGTSLLTYFGHSSATALDYNLDDPSRYNNPGKYPVFMLLGCNAGNFYTFDVSRLQVQSTISEKYVLAPNRGAIALIASTHFGIVSGLATYSRGFYRSVASQAYGQDLGRHIRNSVQFMLQTTGVNYFSQFHTEQQSLHGDPAIKLNNFALPDYSVEQANIQINPSFLSIAEPNFKVRIQYYNIGRATNDSIVVEVKRQLPASPLFPNGTEQVIYSERRRAPLAVDSIDLTVPIQPDRDKGIHRLTVTVDAGNRVSEISELNNSATREFVIFEDELRPVYPANFAIINQPATKLIASTANPFSVTQSYRMEIDTTEFFNSPARVTRTVTSPGGVVEFDPGITLRDSTVYYWRLGVVPGAGGEPARWNTSSFVYLAGTETGFNQSHFYQHTKSEGTRIRMDSSSRRWTYGTRFNNLFVTHSIFPISGTEDSHFTISVNNNLVSVSACVGHSLIFNVFDPVTFAPMRNNPPGMFGSSANSCSVTRNPFNFEWDDRDTANRRAIGQFMDAIPNGSYVVVRKILDQPFENEIYAPAWKSDEAFFGQGNTIYHRLQTAGFASIDSFNRPRTFIFVYKKNDNSFTPVTRMSDGLFDRIQVNLDLPTPDTSGMVKSPVLGPAKRWKQALWNGRPLDDATGDRTRIHLVGVRPNGQEVTLGTYPETQGTVDLSFVSPTEYTGLRLVKEAVDSVKATPWNLNWWRIYYDPVPEGALAPNLTLQSKDTLQQGEVSEFRIAFKNISPTAFPDSLKLRVAVTDKNNVTTEQISRLKPLPPGDTAVIRYPIESNRFPGINTLYVAVNPDNDQPEQFFFNNFLFKNFYVDEDLINPLLDVTFDGVHILNRDIVSARPHVQIKVKDENRSLLLNDTAGLMVRLKFPNEQQPRMYRWNTDTLCFTPPVPGQDNTATIDFFPVLDDDTEDFDYELEVSAKDRNNNPAGDKPYRVSFRVFNKPMISNLLNYPNPFSTSTAFVFTITGSEVPQEFKIQILTVTGRIVREITKAELGPLRVGTNITEFKWDGTDMFGQKLANGVYLYRVVTSLDGNRMDKFRLNDGFDQNRLDVTDKFFRRGYGKMVILR